MPSIFYLIIVWLVIALFFSALSSAIETAYAKVNKLRLERNSKKNKKALNAYKLTKDYPKLIGSILVTNNLVNIGATSAATVLFTYLYPTNGALISSIVMTLTILIFGEILPKTLISKHAYESSLAFAPVLRLIEIIFYPIVFLVNKIIKVISKLYTPKTKEPEFTDEELEVMVEEIEEEGFIDEDTKELVKSAIDFVDVMAYEIMKPRVDMYTFDIDDDINEKIENEDFFIYSRIPVYKDTIDNIVGFLNTNEVLKLKLQNKEINIDNLLVDPIFVHKTKTISSILREFREKQIHLAIVIDEFGGTLGIITLEDILEELVGDIYDETDEIEKEFTKRGDDTYYIDGDMNIFDFLELVNIDEQDFDSEYSTVAGWCTEILEKFPEKGDTFTFKNLTITIQKVDKVRVEKIKVVIEDIDISE